jgi:hypothetical protein
MKSLLVVTAALAFLASPSLWAQKPFFLGATAGAGSTKLSGDVPEDGSYTSKIGFSAGLIAEYAVWDDIHLSVQPSYVSRGTGLAFDVGEVDPRDSLKLTLDYFSIPMMARFVAPGRVWFVNGGLDLGFLLSASLKNVQTESAADVRDLLNGVDLMMIIGVGGNIRLDPAIMTLELRYGQSLLNAGSNDQLAAKAGITPRFRSTGFQFLLGVLFPL